MRLSLHCVYSTYSWRSSYLEKLKALVLLWSGFQMQQASNQMYNVLLMFAFWIYPIHSCNMLDVHVYFQFPCTLSFPSSGILIHISNIGLCRSRLIQVKLYVIIHAHFQSNHLSFSVLLPFRSVHLISYANFSLTILITIGGTVPLVRSVNDSKTFVLVFQCWRQNL